MCACVSLAYQGDGGAIILSKFVKIQRLKFRIINAVLISKKPTLQLLIYSVLTELSPQCLNYWKIVSTFKPHGR